MSQTPDRNERLRQAVSRVRSRGGKRPSVERLLMIAGAILVGVGLPVIVLGWWGASRTPYVFEQIPYLISGGILGLALAVVGGLSYFAYWMTRQVGETKRQAEETQASLRRIEELLAGGALAVGSRSTNGAFVATEKGTMFHRPDCSVVLGRDDVRTVKRTAGLEPCRICDPLGDANPREKAGSN